MRKRIHKILQADAISRLLACVVLIPVTLFFGVVVLAAIVIALAGVPLDWLASRIVGFKLIRRDDFASPPVMQLPKP